MADYLQYRDQLKKQKDFAIAVKETIININRVFSTSFDGSELGHPDYAGLPVTKGMAKAIDDFEKSDKLHEKDENHDIIVTHWKRIFRSIREFMRVIEMEIPNMIESIEKAEKQSIIPIRDYHRYKPFANVMVTLASIYGGSATYEELSSRHRELLPNLEDDLSKIEKIWRGLFVREPTSGKYIMNEFETKQLQTIAGYNMDLVSAKDEIHDAVATELAMYLYTLIPIVKDPVAKEFLNERWAEYMNKPLSEYRGLISEYNLLRLNEKNIHTGIDFLTRDYEYLRDTVRIKREEITNISLGLCSRLKYFVKNLSIRCVHSSCLKSKSVNIIQNVASDLNRIFGDGKEITYGDILRKKEILLKHDQVESLKNTYQVIGFIRYFNKRCTEGLPFKFGALGKDWKFKKYLSKDEKHCLKKEYDKLDIQRINESLSLDARAYENEDKDTFLSAPALDQLENLMHSDTDKSVLANNGGEEVPQISEENEEK